MEEEISKDFVASNANYFDNRSEYDCVSTLILSWIDDDLSSADELLQLRKLFENGLNYNVVSYALPGDGSQQARLRKEVSDFIVKFALEQRSLAVIYYSGHCNEIKGKAQWAAKEKGGPTLIWSDIQSSCFDAVGDVLLILDCCHATLFTKGQKLQGRFEVLVACAKGLGTPGPGEGSFTWALMQVLSGDILEKGITAKELRASMDDLTRETPFWDSVPPESVASIPIKRLKPANAPRFKKKPAGYSVFRASLSDDLDGLQISNWLKTNAPRNVTAVHIEAIVLKARRLQRNLDRDALMPNSVLSKLSSSAQNEIIRHLQSLDVRMAAAKSEARNSLVTGDPETIQDTLDAISSEVEAAQISIETPLLLDTDVTINETSIEGDEAILPETLDNISLHIQATKGFEFPGQSFEVSRDQVRFQNSDGRFTMGTYDNRKVIIELIEYEPDEDGKPQADTIEQLDRMAALLCHGKDLGFHILPGIGYVHVEAKERFGMIYEMRTIEKAAQTPPVTLYELITQHKRMSLSRRVEMAAAIVTAVENLHRVAWIHKAIRSDNICFLQSTCEETDRDEDVLHEVDFSSPWLFGFEYARALDAGTKLEEDQSEFRNLYRHPQRWSIPEVPFTRAHDIYSLGVVLMEIADWHHINDIGRKTSRNKEDPGRRPPLKAQVWRQKLEEKIENDFKHQIGDVFTGVISACLGFDEAAVGLDSYHIQKLFQNSVLGPMQKLARKI